MERRKNLLIVLLSLCAGGLLTYWLYVRYHIVFFFVFIPIIGLGGSLFSRLFKPRRTRKYEGYPDKDQESPH
jgi:hypothetical protein